MIEFTSALEFTFSIKHMLRYSAISRIKNAISIHLRILACLCRFAVFAVFSILRHKRTSEEIPFLKKCLSKFSTFLYFRAFPQF